MNKSNGIQQSAIFHFDIEGGQNNQVHMDTVNLDTLEGVKNGGGVKQICGIFGNVGKSKGMEWIVHNINNTRRRGNGTTGHSEQIFGMDLDGNGGKVEGMICETNSVNVTELGNGAQMESLHFDFHQNIVGPEFEGLKNSINFGNVAIVGQNSAFHIDPVQKSDIGCKIGKLDNGKFNVGVINSKQEIGQNGQIVEQIVPPEPEDGVRRYL